MLVILVTLGLASTSALPWLIIPQGKLVTLFCLVASNLAYGLSRNIAHQPQSPQDGKSICNSIMVSLIIKLRLPGSYSLSPEGTHIVATVVLPS